SSSNNMSFFFQAEDGIRDRNVTGVQTCALPILCTLVLFNDIITEEVKIMPFDGIVTKAVTEQLQEELIDGRINKVYQPTNTELLDRKSTRLNSSHVSISYAVFCLKKKIY